MEASLSSTFEHIGVSIVELIRLYHSRTKDQTFLHVRASIRLRVSGKYFMEERLASLQRLT